MPVTNHVLVGTKHRGEAAVRFVQTMQPGHTVLLVREPQNEFDKNAVKAIAKDFGVIGYLAGSKNRHVSAWMDRQGICEISATFGYAGTGKSKVPGVNVDLPEDSEEA